MKTEVPSIHHVGRGLAEQNVSAQYGENLSSEVFEIMKEDKDSDVPWDSNWTAEQVMRVRDKVEALMSKETVTLRDLVKLSVFLGRFGRKLDLTASSATNGTLIHTLGLLNLALHIQMSGGIVHVIESCDGNLNQVTNDVDIIYEYQGEKVVADYSQNKGYQDGSIYVWPENRMQKKYAVVKSLYPYDESARKVVSYMSRLDYKINLKVEVYDKSPREADFDYSQQLIEYSQGLSMKQVESILIAAAEKSKAFAMDKHGMVQTPTEYKQTQNTFSNFLDVNNSHVSKLYEQWHKKARERESFPKYYSNSFFYDNLQSTKTKDPFLFPNISRLSNPTPDPFLRLKMVSELTAAKGTRNSSLVQALIKCSDGEEYVCDSYDGWDAEFWLGATFQRMRIKGELAKAVRVRFPKSKTWKHYKTFVKNSCFETNKPSTYSDCERDLEKLKEDLSLPGPGSFLIDELKKLSSETLPDSQMASATRSIMTKGLDSLERTSLLSYVSLLQELTMALLANPRKNKSLKTKNGSISGRELILSLETISDRNAVVISNLGALRFGNLRDVNFQVIGDFVGSDRWCKSTNEGMSRVLTFSHAQLDWYSTVFSKAISWMSLSSEVLLSSRVGLTSSSMSQNLIMPLLLSTLNSSKFSQASEMIRYLFVNATGLCSSPQSLYEKINWYRPKNHIEKLYMSRMCKLIDGINQHKARGTLPKLRVRVKALVTEVNGSDFSQDLEQWELAMPDEEVCSYSDQHIYNSFYTCRSMVMQRYNKIMSEAAVLDKQLAARRAYLRVKSLENKHEGRFRDPIHSTEQLYNLLMSDFDTWSHCEPYSPDPLNVLRGALSSILAVHKGKVNHQTLVGAVVQKCFEMGTVCYSMKIKDIMNSRGSVKMAYPTGVSVLSSKLDDKGHKVTRTQNSKCYRTVLEMCQLVLDDKDVPTMTSDDWESLEPCLEPFEVKLKLEEISNMNDRLWPLLYHCVLGFAKCVSKMVHKDQIGSREIAVLNVASRIMCYYVECCARLIRTREHDMGLKTNLIEMHEKMEIVSKSLTNSYSEKSLGRQVVYDSADCSKWGPSMLCHILYISIGVRMDNMTHLKILRNCLSLFGHKVFKIPDAFFSTMTDSDSNLEDSNIINKVKVELANMSEEMGSVKHQLLKLEESMHQGILGASSSVLGSDAQNLTKFILEHLYAEIELKVVSHITSDDYSRILSWNPSENYGQYRICKETLAIHYTLMLTFGIKRNLEKSAFSDRYLEFNSIFFNPNGELRPDVKSRMSFLDYSHHSDPFPISYRSVTQTAEFLRSEGSFIGACWVGTLCNFMSLLQNQGFRLYNKVGADIYKIPLELGGLARVDPLRAVASTPLLSLRANYSSDSKDTFRKFMSIYTAGQSLDPNPTNVDESDKVDVPKISRSGTIRLSKRPSRSVRSLREFLMSIEPSVFAGLNHSRHRSSMLPSLIACCHREESNSDSRGSAENFMATQTSRTAPLYKVNSCLLKCLMDEGEGDRISRDRVHELGEKFLRERNNLSFEEDESISNLEPDNWEASLNRFYETAMPSRISRVSRFITKHVHRSQIANDHFCKTKLNSYDEQYKPACMGGTSGVHPWLYMESRTTYKNMLSKFSKRKQIFKYSLKAHDHSDDFFIKILKSNYMSGCRLSVSYETYKHVKSKVDVVLAQSIASMCEYKHSKGDNEVSLLDPMFSMMWKQGMVGKVDLTDFMNSMLGESGLYVEDIDLRAKAAKTLLEYQNKTHKLFIINPSNIALGIQTVDYVVNQTTKLLMRNVTNTMQETIGRAFMSSQGGTWVHDYTLLREDLQLEESTKTDIYNKIDLSDKGKVVVRVESRRGIVGIFLSDGWLIQVLSQTMLEYTRVTLITDGELSTDRQLLTKLGITGVCNQGFKDLELFYQSSGYKAEDPMDVAAIPSVSAEELSENVLNIGMDLGMDDVDVVGLFDMFEEEGSLTEVEACDKKSEGDGNEYDSDAEELEPMEIGPVYPLSAQGVSEVNPDLVKMVAVGRISEESDREVRKRHHVRRYQTMYYVDLPIKLDKTEFRDDDDDIGLENLFLEISKLDYVDAMWGRQFLIDAINSYGPVIASFRSRSGRRY